MGAMDANAEYDLIDNLFDGLRGTSNTSAAPSDLDALPGMGIGPKRNPMDLYANRVARDAAIGRRRSLDRRLNGSCVWKYLQIVPSVFTARGSFAAFKLLVPVEEALCRLSDSAVLTLDSASELLGRFRFGRGRHVYAYFGATSDVDAIVTDSIGQPLPGNLKALLLAPRNHNMLFTVLCDKLPPYRKQAGQLVVTRAHLVRDFLGFYGLRRDLLVEIENKISATHDA